MRGHPSCLMSLDILQKNFALLAGWSTWQNFNGCLMVLMHHLNADPRVKREGVGETHVERACMESESQMSEESVKGKNFLRTQMLRWSGISNVQISFRQSYYNPIHFFFFFFKKEYREKKKVLPSFEEKAKHLCTKTKWIVNRCTAHLWSNKFFSIHWQTIQNRRRRHCSRADITIQFTQLWKSQIPTMTRDSQKVIVYTWSIMGK